jgi:hypothetical protein
MTKKPGDFVVGLREVADTRTNEAEHRLDAPELVEQN